MALAPIPLQEFFDEPESAREDMQPLLEASFKAAQKAFNKAKAEQINEEGKTICGPMPEQRAAQAFLRTLGVW